MADEKKTTKQSGMTRREFIQKTTIAGAALGVPMLARPAFAAKKRDFILIGRVQPDLGSHFLLRRVNSVG